MQRAWFAMIGLCLAVAPAWAQSQGGTTSDQQTTTTTTDDSGTGGSTSTPGEVATMAQLLQDGYEIKAAVPSGTSKLIIFMQNEKSAYACEFTNLENTRCGSIN